MNQLKGNQNFSKAKIIRIVKDLIKKRKIIIGSRIAKDNVLDNPFRRRIYEYILNNPGSTNYDIRKFFDVGANQIIWHLNFLRKFKFIRIIEIEKHKVIFSLNSDPKYDLIYYCFANEKIKSILEIFKQKEDPLSPSDISNLLSMHYNTVNKNLERLRELKIIELIKEKKRKKYILDYKRYNEIMHNKKE